MWIAFNCPIMQVFVWSKLKAMTKLNLVLVTDL